VSYRIPFNKPFLIGEEAELVARCLASGSTAGDGPFTRECQELMESRFAAARVLLTTSCTAALEMAALLCEVAPGDEVILPSYTFVSTANAFLLRGATLKFVDVRPDTLNIDERLLEQAITPRTKVIVPVHYASIGCEMDAIGALARRHSLQVVEDAAQAVAATYRGRYLGTVGTLGAFSFHASKNFGCGEGGALLVNDASLADRAEIIREKGTNRSRFFRGQVDKYTWVDAGSSYVPADVLAALLLPQLRNMEEITARRRRVYESYFGALPPLAEHPGALHVELSHVLRDPAGSRDSQRADRAPQASGHPCSVPLRPAAHLTRRPVAGICSRHAAGDRVGQRSAAASADVRRPGNSRSRFGDRRGVYVLPRAPRPMSEAQQTVREIAGVKCFAPALAQAEETYPAEAFARLVQLEASSFWFRSRNRIIGRVFRKYLQQPARPRVLEIGCGTGFVLSALHAQQRFDLVGAEQHVAGLVWARRRLPQVEFVQLDARHLPYRAEFDAIGAFDVLEHIPEDEAVMASVHQALRPNGLFVVTVPQHAWLWSAADEQAHHQRRYSRAELRAKLERHGFKVRFCSSFVFTLLPLMYLARRRRKATGNAEPGAVECDELSLPAALDRLMETGMRLDEWLIAAGLSLPVGGSLLMVAERITR
jgi:dTDP-4-amino-4,6-dideoxygalactose transaminase